MYAFLNQNKTTWYTNHYNLYTRLMLFTKLLKFGSRVGGKRRALWQEDNPKVIEALRRWCMSCTRMREQLTSYERAVYRVGLSGKTGCLWNCCYSAAINIEGALKITAVCTRPRRVWQVAPKVWRSRACNDVTNYHDVPFQCQGGKLLVNNYVLFFSYAKNINSL